MQDSVEVKKRNVILSIKAETLEWFIVVIILAFSFFNNITLLVSLVVLFLFYLKQKEVGAIKLLNIITFRTIINPGIAVSMSVHQNLKWIFIFIVSLYLISLFRKFDTDKKKIVSVIFIPFIAFAIFNMMSSLFFSTLPTIAMFKVISYSVPFSGVMIGMIYTKKNYNWLAWLDKLFFIIILFSMPLLLSPLGYLRNGHAFQGITNQPNMFGIVLALYTGLTLTIIQKSSYKKSMKKYIMIPIIIILIILSKSRTAFISAILLLILFFVYSKHKKIEKILVFNLIGVVSIIYMILRKDAFDFFYDFLLKGQESLIYSRIIQVDGLINNFYRSPWLGSGFAVPVTPFKSYSFSVEHVVEPGNLFLAVMSYSGIIGLFLFLNLILKLFLVNKIHFKEVCFLPFATILISMGEMVFFSTNNIGIWIYMFLALYVINISDKENKSVIKLY